MEWTADSIGANLCAAERCNPNIPFVALSNGCDSPVAAILAKRAGCQHSATITTARTLFHQRQDSGEPVANCLRLAFLPYQRNGHDFKHEAAVWAGNALPSDLNLASLDYPQPLTCLFTGFYGNKVWTTDFHLPLERKPMMGMDFTGTGLSEWRLTAGILHCPVAFWGIHNIGAIRNITISAEMPPYRLNTDYDRPIPRRIIESQGIPRGSFAVRKSATSIEPFARFPHSLAARERFRAYLKDRGRVPSADWMVHAIGLLNCLDSMMVLSPLRKKQSGGGYRSGDNQLAPRSSFIGLLMSRCVSMPFMNRS